MTPTTPLEPGAPARANPAPSDARRMLRLSFWSRIEVAAASLSARHHPVNEDAHSPLAEVSRVLVLADGVGGGALASDVSRQLVARLQARLERGPIDADTIHQAVLEADRALREFIATRTAEPGAATLALCAWAGGSAAHWWLAWVGDCRIYALGTGRGEPARLLTHDDTYRHLGEVPPRGGSPDDPARMVGNGAVSQPNTRRVRLRRGERLLLCSDGVHKHLTEHQMAEVLHAESPLDARCRELVRRARAAGSTDDATALVLERRRLSWMPMLALFLGLVLLLALGGLALWNAYGLGGRAEPPVFAPDEAASAVVPLPPVTEPASAAGVPPGEVPR